VYDYDACAADCLETAGRDQRKPKDSYQSLSELASGNNTAITAIMVAYHKA